MNMRCLDYRSSAPSDLSHSADHLDRGVQPFSISFILTSLAFPTNMVHGSLCACVCVGGGGAAPLPLWLSMLLPATSNGFQSYTTIHHIDSYIKNVLLYISD